MMNITEKKKQEDKNRFGRHFSYARNMKPFENPQTAKD